MIRIALLALFPLLAHGVEMSTAARLAQVRRVYVEPLTGGAPGTQMRDMLIAALEKSGLYTLTEDPEHADAVLRGSADDQIFTETHSTSDSIGFNSHVGAGSSSKELNSGVSSNSSVGAGVNQSESNHVQERRHEAAVSVRLVDREGDVLWSTTQESAGGKFRGAMADVADKVARDLTEQTHKVRATVK